MKPKKRQQVAKSHRVVFSFDMNLKNKTSQHQEDHKVKCKGGSQGAFCVQFMPKIANPTPTFIINYIVIFETPRQRSQNFCARNAPWGGRHSNHISTMNLLFFRNNDMKLHGDIFSFKLQVKLLKW